MHMPTGEIFELDEGSELLEKFREHNNEMHEDHIKASKQELRFSNVKEKMVALSSDEAKLLKPLNTRLRKNVMRNQPCVCGSGKKFKKCCWSKFK